MPLRLRHTYMYYPGSGRLFDGPGADYTWG